MAAPPVMVFDTAGNFISWGGAASGFDWPSAEHGIHIDYKGFVWDRRQQLPHVRSRRLKPVADDALLKFSPDGKLVMQIGRSNQSKGDTDTATCTALRTHGCIQPATKSSWPTATATIASSCSTR